MAHAMRPTPRGVVWAGPNTFSGLGCYETRKIFEEKELQPSRIGKFEREDNIVKELLTSLCMTGLTSLALLKLLMLIRSSTCRDRVRVKTDLRKRNEKKNRF